MAVEKMVIPVGFQFQPQENEIICYYLYKKSRGEPLKEHEKNVIVERQLYGKDASPWNVLNEDDPWQDADAFDSKKVIYVFSKVTPTTKGGKKISRTAGCGKWDSKAVSNDITLSVGGRDRVIGHRTQFTFKAKNGYEREAARKGHWIMHEYSFPSSADKKDENGDSWVICRITKELVEVGKDGKKRKLIDIDQDNGADDHIAAEYDDRIVSEDEMNMEKKRMCIINGGKRDMLLIEGSEGFVGSLTSEETMINNYDPFMASTSTTTNASSTGYLSDVVHQRFNYSLSNNVSCEPSSWSEFRKSGGLCVEEFIHNPLMTTSMSTGAAEQGYLSDHHHDKYSVWESSAAAVDFPVQILEEEKQQQEEEKLVPGDLHPARSVHVEEDQLDSVWNDLPPLINDQLKNLSLMPSPSSPFDYNNTIDSFGMKQQEFLSLMRGDDRDGIPSSPLY